MKQIHLVFGSQSFEEFADMASERIMPDVFTLEMVRHDTGIRTPLSAFFCDGDVVTLAGRKETLRPDDVLVVNLNTLRMMQRMNLLTRLTYLAYNHRLLGPNLPGESEFDDAD